MTAVVVDGTFTNRRLDIETAKIECGTISRKACEASFWIKTKPLAGH